MEMTNLNVRQDLPVAFKNQDFDVLAPFPIRADFLPAHFVVEDLILPIPFLDVHFASPNRSCYLPFPSHFDVGCPFCSIFIFLGPISFVTH